MKVLSSIPSKPAFNMVLESVRKEEPVLMPAVSQSYMRPLEIRRFIRDFRKSRQINYTRDFMF